MAAKKVVVLGGGYAGISTAKALEKKFKNRPDLEVQMIERNTYHTLLTELHEVAGGRVSPRSVRIGLNRLFKTGKVQIVQDKIDNIDFDEQLLHSANESYPYDYLVIATGSRPFFFGLQGIETLGFKLWSYKEAVVVRDHIYDCFHNASTVSNREKRKKMLSFVVAGGGFTGVEMAGELGEWKNKLCKQFSIDKEEVSIYLLEALPNILNIFDLDLANKCKKRLEKLGVQVLTQCGIERVDKDGIYLNTKRKIEGTLIWTAGIQGNPYLENMDIKYDRRFRVEVNEFMQSVQHKNVFCAGDTISYLYNEKPLPQIVETAVQSGESVADNIGRLLAEKKMKPFIPNYHGVMVSVGSVYAVAKLKSIKLSGLLATGLKHLVNVHYLFGIGGLSVIFDYLNHEFTDRFFTPRINTIHNDPLHKNVTQF
jgi:NADH dehydrogenase